MKRMFSILPVFLLVSFSVKAQIQDPSKKNPSYQYVGLGIEDLSLIDQLMVTVPGVGSNARDMLTQQNIKAYMMPVRRIGFRGSESSYLLASSLEYYVNLNKNYKLNLSPDYISLNLSASGQDKSLKDGLMFLSQTGTVNAAIMPYDADAITSAVYATQKYRIVNYLHLFREVTKDRQRTFECRKALMRGNPVLIDLKADESLKTMNGERFWAPSGEGSGVYPLLVVGFDENLRAFEVMSCWGSLWGTGGYLWIRYEDFERYAVNGFVMIPAENYQ